MTNYFVTSRQILQRILLVRSFYSLDFNQRNGGGDGFMYMIYVQRYRHNLNLVAATIAVSNFFSNKKEEKKEEKVQKDELI